MKKIIFSAFDMIAASQVGHGLWRHPDSQRHRYVDPAYWVDPAIYGAALACETTHLGFAITQSTSFEPPFTVMRRLCSLDQLSKRQFAWNIVTSALPTQAGNHGVPLAPHDERNDMADEFLDVSYKLTKGSWKEGYKGGRDSGKPFFYNPDAIKKISHESKYFKVEGPFCMEPSPQKTPVLCQAGGSGRGKRIAARRAELVLVAADSPEQAHALVKDIRELAESEFGRDPKTLKFLLLCGVIVDANDVRASARIQTYEQHWSREGARGKHRPLQWSRPRQCGSGSATSGSKDTNPNRSQANSRRFAGTPKKVKDIIDEISGFAKQYVMFTGGYQKVADQMEAWLEAGGIDGFNMLPFVHPADFDNMVAFLVPELQKRGRYKREYAPGTLREKIFGMGPALSPSHPDAQYRTSI